MVFINYEKLDESLPDLQFAYEDDCCFDFVSAIDVDIYPNSKKPTMVPTGMKFEIPSGYELQVRSRSGLAAKNGIQVFNSPGTVDAHFSNQVQVLLMNFGEDVFRIGKGDRIAQGKIAIKPSVVMLKVNEIKSIGRGLNGFGSTGVK